MPIDTEQWRAQTGLFCASRVLLQPPRCKQPQPKVQADTLSLNMRFTLAVLLVTLRTGVFYASRTLQLLCLIACHTSWLLSSIVRLSCRRLRGVSVLLALCLVVVQMLLIMSGDVEENPGPPKIRTTSLGVSDLLCVQEELLDVSRKWFDIGLALELNVGILECVRDVYSDPSTALREMLLHWLKKVDPPPTWEGLACALERRTVGEPRLAEQLRTKYCKTEGAAGGSVGQTAAAIYKEEERPSHPSRHIRRLLPAVPAGGLVRPKLQTVHMSSKERPPHPDSRHDRIVPPSQRLPSIPSHTPPPIARKEGLGMGIKFTPHLPKQRVQPNGSATSPSRMGDSGESSPTDTNEKHDEMNRMEHVVRAMYTFGGASEDDVRRNQSQGGRSRGKRVEHIVSFGGGSEDELQFDKGDLITVTKVVDGGWWEGICNGRMGWFPGNFAEELPGGSVGQTTTATEEEQPLLPSRPIHRLLPAASRSYISRPMTQKQPKPMVSNRMDEPDDIIELKELCLELHTVDNWFNLGLYLGIPYSKLKTIEVQYPDPHRCRTEMLQAWLDNSETPPSWSEVIDALKLVGMKRLAEKLAAKKLSCFPPGHVHLQRNSPTQPQGYPSHQQACSLKDKDDEAQANTLIIGDTADTVLQSFGLSEEDTRQTAVAATLCNPSCDEGINRLSGHIANRSRIHTVILEGPYFTLHEAGLPLSMCLELQHSKVKVEKTQWTVQKTETAKSVSLLWQLSWNKLHVDHSIEMADESSPEPDAVDWRKQMIEAKKEEELEKEREH